MARPKKYPDELVARGVALVHHSDAGIQPSYAFAGHKPTGEQGTGSQIEDAFAIRHAFVVASSATEMEQ